MVQAQRRSVSAVRGWAIVLALAAYLTLAYHYLYDIWLIPRISLQPWLLRNGFVVYRDIADQHEAALPTALSLVLPIVGDPVALARWLLILTSAAGLVAVYLVIRRAHGEKAALLAAVYFTVWAPVLLNGWPWYDAVLGPLYLVAYALWPLDRSTALWRVAAAGFTLGVAVTVKQYAWLPVAVYVAWLAAPALWRPASFLPQLRRGLPFAVGVLVPFATSLALIAASGALEQYLRWAWMYNLTGYQEEAARAPETQGMLACAALLLPAFVVLFATARDVRATGAQAARKALPALLTIVATATAYPRFELFHLAAALPLASLVLVQSLAVCFARERQSASLSDACQPARRTPSIQSSLRPALLYPAVVAAISLTVLVPAYPTLGTPGAPQLHVWTELQPVARAVQFATAPGERIFLFPDVEVTSNTYLLSQRLPPQFWIYTYPWYMNDETTKKVIKQLEDSDVRTIVYFRDRKVQGLTPREIAPALADYIDKHYKRLQTIRTPGGRVDLMGKREAPR